MSANPDGASRPLRVGVVSNPRSSRNLRRGMARIEEALARHPEVLHLRFDPGDDLARIAERLAEGGVELLVVNSGDGTFHGLLTEILEGGAFPTPPLMSHLARGGANLTARDCGLRRGTPTELERLFALARDGRGALAPHAVTRRVLKLEGLEAPTPQRGFFLGLAGIVDGIRLFKGGSRAHGAYGYARTIAGLLAKAALKGPAAAGIGPHRVELRLDGGEWVERTWLIALVTTLERAILGSAPFWGPDEGTIRLTEVDQDAPKLLRHAYPVLYGKPERRLPEGYRSTSPDRIELRTQAPVSLDGEFFRALPNRPIVITAEESLRFVRL